MESQKSFKQGVTKSDFGLAGYCNFSFLIRKYVFIYFGFLIRKYLHIWNFVTEGHYHGVIWLCESVQLSLLDDLCADKIFAWIQGLQHPPSSWHTAQCPSTQSSVWVSTAYCQGACYHKPELSSSLLSLTILTVRVFR